MFSTSTHNHEFSETPDEINENQPLETFFNRADITSVYAYGPIGDPKVSR